MLTNGSFLSPIFDNIPLELRGYPHWVVWCTIPGVPKPRKMPLNPGRGYPASTKKPESWGPFAQAVAFYKGHHGKEHRFRLQDAHVTGVIRGIGFVLSEAAPFAGVDLDQCVANDGTVAPWALTIVNRLQSYTEFSPSGAGLRIFVRAEKAGDKCRQGGIEIYRTLRYLTVTGHRFATNGEANV